MRGLTARPAGAATAAPAGRPRRKSCPSWCVRHEDGAHQAAPAEVPLSLHPIDVAPALGVTVEMTWSPSGAETAPVVSLDSDAGGFTALTLDEAARLSAVLADIVERGRAAGVTVAHLTSLRGGKAAAR